MSWYETKTNECLGNKQDLQYHFQFYDSGEQNKKTKNLKRKQEEETPSHTQTQNDANCKSKTNKQINKQTKKDIPKKKKRKITQDNFI